MDKGTDRTIKEFISKVFSLYSNLVKAYIFGSFAKGNQTTESDIDIALVFDHLNDAQKFEFQVQLMLLAYDFDTRIEPHPISKEDFDTDNPFTVEIKRSGIDMTASVFQSK